jgi:serine/threonine-protein kinase
VNGFASVIVHDASQTRLALIEGGSFTMGAFDQVKPRQDDLPAHSVSLDDHYMQETEVTFGQMEMFFDEHREIERPGDYRQKLGELRAAFEEDEALRHPAVYVGHDLARQFAEWVGGRLPTEAEWEHAARSRGEDYVYPWGNDPNLAYEPGRLNINQVDCTSVCTKPAGTMDDDRTEQGIRDMAGNVREWCQDVWGAYAEGPIGNPTGPPAVDPKSDEYVVRGGSFERPLEFARTTRRDHERPGATYADLGFRVVLETKAAYPGGPSRAVETKPAGGTTP